MDGHAAKAEALTFSEFVHRFLQACRPKPVRQQTPKLGQRELHYA